MKCSNCGNEMVHSRAGWLCISCGHVEASDAPLARDAKITTGKDSHAQMRSASLAHSVPLIPADKPSKKLDETNKADKVDEASERIDKADEPVDKPEVKSAESPDEPRPHHATASHSEAPDNPTAAPPPVLAPWEVAPAAAADQAADGPSANKPVADSAPLTPAAPPARPAPPVAPPPAEPTDAKPLATKPPLTPGTRPQPMRRRPGLAIVVGVILLAAIAGGILYASQHHASGAPMATPPPIPNPTSTPTTTPAASSSPSPSASPAADAATRDNMRKTDMSAYMTAYKAAATNGYFPIEPPAVNLSPKDPTTGQPYAISKAKPTAVGQIQYWPGGSCTGPAHTPGQTGTRYLALVTMLDDGHTTFCVDNFQ